jgi:ubiquinone/menaquinone biosynthesis C-methylase UbiE
MAELRWQLSGSAAEKYERFVATWFAPWAVDLVDRTRLEQGSRVLDLACGTGVVARAAAPIIGPNGSIVGSDANEGMLIEAAKHAPAGAAVEWRQADAANLPFESDSFDAVLCQQGLQFVPDKAAATAEMRRVLRPGGLAAVSLWRSPEHNPYITALSDGLSRQLSEEAGQAMSAPCGFGDRDVVEQLFSHAGFAGVQVDVVTRLREPVSAREAIEGNLAAIPSAEQVHAMTEAAYEDLIADIETQLSPFISDGVLTVPMSSHVVLARA